MGQPVTCTCTYIHFTNVTFLYMTSVENKGFKMEIMYVRNLQKDSRWLFRQSISVMFLIKIETFSVHEYHSLNLIDIDNVSEKISRIFSKFVYF